MNRRVDRTGQDPAGWKDCGDCCWRIPIYGAGRKPKYCEACRSRRNAITDRAAKRRHAARPEVIAKRRKYDATRPPQLRDQPAEDLARKLRRYGLSPERFFALEEEGCAICGNPFSGTASGRGARRLDHDHGTGTFRGLLCDEHNLGLGHFGDSPELLRAAANYLERTH